ncbi:MAG: hypothetical protein IPL43_14350 [Micropruina sp.]|nr:hypothetical protein [Micropruina sp.]
MDETEAGGAGVGESTRGESSTASSGGESSRGESSRGESSRGESSRGESGGGESSRGESSRGESGRGESSGGESSGGESSRGESGGGEPSRDASSSAQSDGDPSRDASGGDVFDLLAAARERRLQAQADELSLIVDACVQHRVNEATANRGVERLVAGGADGTPLVGEFLAHELALVLRIPPTAAALRMVAALNLKHRHPRLWTAVQQLELETWQAARVATDCASAGLSRKAAHWVDEQLATASLMLPWPRAVRHLTSLIIKADPAAAAAR